MRDWGGSETSDLCVDPSRLMMPPLLCLTAEFSELVLDDTSLDGFVVLDLNSVHCVVPTFNIYACRVSVARSSIYMYS